MYSISFAGDAFCERELDYADKGTLHTECIAFRMRFRSPVFGGDVWNQKFEYNWTWYLARTQNGDWNILTGGEP